ncbi:MAG: glycosyltransferase [Prevotella sp.]
MKPKVSVIVPVYNVEKYLNRCINSLLGQTLKDIEIILVDDESPDNCPQICDNYANKHTNIYVIHKKNEGLGMARNSGLELARGEYVAFIDSDDYVDSVMFEKLYDECKHSTLDVIYSEFNVDEYPGFRIVLRDRKIYNGADEVEQLRLDIVGAEPSYISSVKFQCSACKGLYSRQLIANNKISFYSEREYISEDMLFNLDILGKANRVETTPWQFYHYCLNGASLSHSYRADRWPRLLMMIDKLSEYRDSFKFRDEFDLRLKRTGISYTRSGVAQQLYRPKKEIKEGIVEVINNPKVISFINNYPLSKLPRNWKIFSYLVKYRCYWGLNLIEIMGKKLDTTKWGGG